MENNGKYDDYPFPAGRMTRKNGFGLLALIEAVIDMFAHAWFKQECYNDAGNHYRFMRFHDSHYCWCACDH